MAVRGGFSAEIEVGIARLRSVVASLHRELDARANGASVSARLAGADLFLIPSIDVPAAELAPEHLVLFTLDGETVEDTPGSDQTPPADALAHAAVYRALADVGGIAALATSPSESDGEVVPVADSAGEALVLAVVAALSPAGGPATVSLPGYGVYATGSDARSAVNALLARDRSDASG